MALRWQTLALLGEFNASKRAKTPSGRAEWIGWYEPAGLQLDPNCLSNQVDCQIPRMCKTLEDIAWYYMIFIVDMDNIRSIIANVPLSDMGHF